MFYGLVMDTIRDGILRFYGPIMWNRVVHELHLTTDTFDFYQRYDDRLLVQICDCLVEILNDGTRESYLEFFGGNFIHYFYRYGFDRILRVAGRTFRDFLFAIDQLHDSNRYVFPQMHQPIFHVTEENQDGAVLHYKSVRHGLSYFAIGGLRASAAVLFDQNEIGISIQEDLSTDEYSHIVFWVRFNNPTYLKKRLFNRTSWPQLNGETFFQIFPFSILMDSSLRVLRMGHHVSTLFPDDAELNGRLITDIFRLVRPDIHFEWNKVLSYGRHIVFLMENRLALRAGPSSHLRLKGQMKYLENQHLVWFLCHPVLENVDDMISAGLHMTDLNLFDSTGNLLVQSIHQEQELRMTRRKEQIYSTQTELIQQNLRHSRRENEALLCLSMPKHVALLVQSGINVENLCECHALASILFVSIVDFESSIDNVTACSMIEALNRLTHSFDKIVAKFEVFRIQMNPNGTYMVLAGIHDQSFVSTENENNMSKNEIDSFCHVDSHDENLGILFEYNATEIIAMIALEFRQINQQTLNPMTNKPFSLKFGFHSGMVVGAIIGKQNIQYCVFGNTVKIARLMAQNSEIGRIHFSQVALNSLSTNKRFSIEYRGEIDIENKGVTDTYWLLDSKKRFSKTSINKETMSFSCPFSGLRPVTS